MQIIDERRILAIVCGQLLQHHRKREQWNQAELALRARLQPSTLSRMERGEVLPDLASMHGLERAFDWEPGQLSRHVDTAMTELKVRTRETFRRPKSGEKDWWRLVAGVAGVAGIAAITALAIGAMEESRSE